MPRPRGSVEQRGPDTFRITVPLGSKPDGTYDRYRETFRGTKAQAEVRRTTLLHKMDTGKLTSTDGQTYGEYLLQWLQTYAKSETGARTYDEYERFAKKRIIPSLGSIPLNKLGPIHIDRFYASLKKDGARHDGKKGGLGAASILKIHAVVHESLAHAAQWHLIPHNPADNLVNVPKQRRGKQKKRRYWNQGQLKRFLTELQTHPHRPLILTLAMTGMRIGEVFALQWHHVDFETRTFLVEQSLNLRSRDVGPTKNHQVRTLPIDEKLLEVLKTHKSNQNKIMLKMKGQWNPDHFLFVTGTGRPMHYSNFRTRIWVPLIEKCELPYINIHGLRHTFTTILMGTEIDPKVVSEMLGHHSVAFTLEEYDHPEEEDRRRAVDIFSHRVQGS